MVAWKFRYCSLCDFSRRFAGGAGTCAGVVEQSAGYKTQRFFCYPSYDGGGNLRSCWRTEGGIRKNGLLRQNYLLVCADGDIFPDTLVEDIQRQGDVQRHYRAELKHCAEAGGTREREMKMMEGA